MTLDALTHPEPSKPCVHNVENDRPSREFGNEVHVAVPHEVNVPLPPTTHEQISIPASINGRNLSDGRP
jgi:hypothetical protein